MDVKKELQEVKDKRQKIVNELNELATEVEQIQGKRQLLVQEALRLDGEVRILERLNGDKEV